MLTILLASALAAEPQTFPGATRIVVDLPIGDVTVLATTETTGITVIPTEQAWAEDCELTMSPSQDGTVAKVEVVIHDRSRRKRSSEGCTIDLSVSLPTTTVIDLDMGIGDIVLTGLSGAVEIDLGVGDLQIESTGPLEADIGAGSIRGTVGSILDADVGAGSVHLGSLVGDANLSVSAGDVGLTWLTLPEDIDISVGAGSVIITLPDGSIFEADLDTGVGGINSLFEQRPGAPSQIEVDVGVGDIQIIR